MMRWKARALGTSARAFRWSASQSAIYSPLKQTRNPDRTGNLLPVLVQLDFCVGLDEDLDQHDAIIGAAPDTLHEAGISDAPLVLDVAKLRDIDASRAGGRRGEGKALTHGGQLTGSSGEVIVRMLAAKDQAPEAQPSSFWGSQHKKRRVGVMFKLRSATVLVYETFGGQAVAISSRLESWVLRRDAGRHLGFALSGRG